MQSKSSNKIELNLQRQKLRTKGEIELNLKSFVPGIKSVYATESLKKDSVDVYVELPWWKWALPGILHYLFRKQIEKVLLSNGYTNVLYSINIS